ncbi:DUF948 domain-containing protein [Paenibacillus chartarius]|uniref:DUF948 domain-containing protein n=1 Tax=Paenibacillus chartarius TaxID=747481 RepID=A0ABV6DRU6_9BACL
MQVIEWCAIAATAAFIALAVVAIRTLTAARIASLQAVQTLQKTSQSMERLERQLGDMGAQTTALLLKTDAIADEVQTKLQTFKTIASTVQELGSSLSEAGGTVCRASKTLARSIVEVEQAVHTHRARVQDALEWAVTGMELWQQWQAGRKAQRNETTPNGNKERDQDG